MLKTVAVSTILLAIIMNISCSKDAKEETTDPPNAPSANSEPKVSGNQNWIAMQKRTEEQLGQLRNYGDNAKKVRKVDHFAYFKTKEDATKYEKWVKSQGATVEPIHMNGNEFSVAYQMEHDLLPTTISKLTKSMFDKCLELSGEYDGWGCQVEQ